MHMNVPEEEAIHLAVDEKSLPSLIQGQMGKLHELDEGVKKALTDATDAEIRAREASELSAGRSFFSDDKRKAIEGLQVAGSALAKAVQAGTKAQKLSFELQMRFADVTRYLFSLGVSNIAANRVVVRELEMRLRGASEEELSDLARQELMSVIRQLKEQEDLLRKQEQMREALSGHNVKIKHLLAQTDDLAGTIGSLSQASMRQEEAITNLTNEALSQRSALEALTVSLADARVHADASTSNVLERTRDLASRFEKQEIQQRAIAHLIEPMEQALKAQQQEIAKLEQHALEQHASLERLTTELAQAGSHAERATASLRAAANLRTVLLVVWALAVPVAIHFLW